jgi:hypothetical protein
MGEGEGVATLFVVSAAFFILNASKQNVKQNKHERCIKRFCKYKELFVRHTMPPR